MSVLIFDVGFWGDGGVIWGCSVGVKGVVVGVFGYELDYDLELE